MVGFLVAANPLGEAYITTSDDFRVQFEQRHSGEITLYVPDDKEEVTTYANAADNTMELAPEPTLYPWQDSWMNDLTYRSMLSSPSSILQPANLHSQAYMNRDHPVAFSASSSRTASSRTAFSRTASSRTAYSSPERRRTSTPDSSRRYSILNRFRKESRSIPTGSNLDYLPAEANDYLGLCRGAWRMQVGQDANAVTIGQRPSGDLYKAIRYIVCSQAGCRFEGRAVGDSSGHDSIDRTVIRFSDQVHFRWEFLMRNHVKAKTKAAVSFGCVLCSSSHVTAPSGMLPIFDGERAFMEHIQEVHVGDGQWPEGPAKSRTGCVVSKYWPDDDNWDLLLLDDNVISSRHMPPRGVQNVVLESVTTYDQGEPTSVFYFDNVEHLDLDPETSS